jgi:AcrR family transcriptional regulator
VDEAATSTALRLITDEGYASVTMERIAEQAGVSKAALYRRWPNKVALVADAVGLAAQSSFIVPDTGCIREDVIGFVANLVRDRNHAAGTYEALAAAVGSDRELGDRCGDVLSAGLTGAFRSIVARGVARGELPAATDVELLADVVPALIRFRRQTTGAEPDAAFMERIADQFFPGSHVTTR